MSSPEKPAAAGSDISDLSQILAVLKQIKGEQVEQRTLLEKVVQRIDALETRVGLGQPKSPTSKTSPTACGPSGGGGGGGGGGGSGGSSSSGGSGTAAAKTPLSSSGSSSPKYPPLCAAFAASTFPALVFPTGKYSSRSLSAQLQSTLFAHRLSTALREDECAREPLDHCQCTVLPDPEKGFSHFVVASLDPAVLAEAHAVRGAATKSNCGCVALPLASLPPELVLTLDHVLHYSTENKPIVLHATLSPSAPMPYSDFVAAYRAWGNFVVCKLRAAGEAHESKNEEEGEAEPMGYLSTFSEISAPYALAQLTAHAAKVAQNAGGSPGKG